MVIGLSGNSGKCEKVEEWANGQVISGSMSGIFHMTESHVN